MESRTEPGNQRVYALARVAAGLPLALLGLWLLGLGTHVAGWAATIPAVLQYPYQLDYGEGIVWQQARMILRGDGYSDIAQLPYVVFHYPPVYHLLSGAAAKLLAMPELAAGRLVSIAATLGFAAIIGALVFIGARQQAGRLPAVICAGAAGLIVLTFLPVTYWARVMRVDMAALFFSFLGVWFALRAPEQSWRAVAAIGAFLLALFTKQTMIAPPISMLVVLFLIRPRLAVYCGLGGLFGGLALILALNVLTDGGFTNHVIFYNINRVDWTRLRWMLGILVLFVPYMVIAFSFFRDKPKFITIFTMREQLTSDLYLRLKLFVLIYFLFSCLMLLMVAKVGSFINYLLEWTLATSFAVGLFLAGPVRAALDHLIQPPGAARPGKLSALIGRRDYLGPCAVFALLLVQLAVLPRADLSPLAKGPAYVDQQRMLLQIVRAADRPVISDEMVILLQTGKEVVWESAIFAELAEVGTWNDEAFLQMIRENRFAFFLTEYYQGHPLFDSRYTDRVAAAMRKAYPRKVAVGHFVLHLPAR